MDMAMQVLETRVENTFERTRAYPQELAETGRISLSQTSVSKLLGQVRCICPSWRDNDASVCVAANLNSPPPLFYSPPPVFYAPRPLFDSQDPRDPQADTRACILSSDMISRGDGEYK